MNHSTSKKEYSLKERAIFYCNAGENCSRAILKAGAEYFDIELSEDMLNSCNAISSGFGIGGICSGLVAGVMLLGLLFDDEEARQKSLLFFCYVQTELGGLNCCEIAGVENCERVMEIIGDVLQGLIEAS